MKLNVKSKNENGNRKSEVESSKFEVQAKSYEGGKYFQSRIIFHRENILQRAKEDERQGSDSERRFDYPTEISLVRERFSELICAGDCILVVVFESKVIAMALLHRTRFLHCPPDGRIVLLVVSETYRSRGVGARLIEAAESVFRDWGCGRVEITSGAARGAAHRFYIRAGYSEQPKRFIKLL